MFLDQSKRFLFTRPRAATRRSEITVLRGEAVPYLNLGDRGFARNFFGAEGPGANLKSVFD